MRDLKKRLIIIHSFLFSYLIKGWKNSKIIKPFSLKVILGFLKGFWPDSTILYNISGESVNLYISDYKRLVKLSLLNYKYSHILDDKYIFENIFPNCIQSLGLIHKNYIIPKEKNVLLTIKMFLEQLVNGQKILLKHRRGGGGNTIFTLSKNNNIFFINETLINKDDLINKLQSCNDFLIFPYYKQDGFSNKFFPETLNTIRVLSVIDENSKPIIIRALHRFGTQKSIPADNWSSGGICCNIDINNGTLSDGVVFPYNGKIKFHREHPDTGELFYGQIIPDWNKIIDLVIESHSHIPFLPYIGWDIVLDHNDIKILEANSNSDVNLFQIHEPLLKNNDLLNFLKANNIK